MEEVGDVGDGVGGGFGFGDELEGMQEIRCWVGQEIVVGVVEGIGGFAGEVGGLLIIK